MTKVRVSLSCGYKLALAICYGKYSLNHINNMGKRGSTVLVFFRVQPTGQQKNIHPYVYIRMKGVVSKETVVLRLWGSSIQKFGFINGVDNVNWPPFRDSKS